jgi:hypothetical protein
VRRRWLDATAMLLGSGGEENRLKNFESFGRDLKIDCHVANQPHYRELARKSCSAVGGWIRIIGSSPVESLVPDRP